MIFRRTRINRLRHAFRFKNSLRFLAAWFLLWSGWGFSTFPCMADEPQLLEITSHLPLENLLTGMLAQSSSELLVLENDSGEITRISYNQASDQVSFETLEQGFTDPIALTQLNDQSLIVAERRSGRIIRLLAHGGREVLAEGLIDISSVREGEQGQLIICELDPGRILALDLQSRRIELLDDERYFPSDALQWESSLLIAELFDRQGVLGQVVRIPYGNLFVPSSPTWTNVQGIVDPTRLALDPFSANTLMVSARLYQEPGETERRIDQDSGAVVLLDTQTGQQRGVLLDGLAAPTDIAVTQRGIFVLEERAERIHYLSRTNQREIVWDGLGEPSAFGLRQNDPARFWVAETLPQPVITQVSGGRADRTIYAATDEEMVISGMATAPEAMYLSAAQRGEIYQVDNQDRMHLFSQAIFAPGKMQIDQEGHLLVLDQLLNELAWLSTEDAQVQQRISPDRHRLADFTLSQEEGGESIYLLSRAGGILRADPELGSLEEVFQAAWPALETSFDQEAPVFAYVPSQGFIIAVNDQAGTLLWAEPESTTVSLATGYRQVSQMIFAAPNQLHILSERGWIRTLHLGFGEQPFPTPTPTPPVTSIPNWQLFDY